MTTHEERIKIEFLTGGSLIDAIDELVDLGYDPFEAEEMAYAWEEEQNV